MDSPFLKRRSVAKALVVSAAGVAIASQPRIYPFERWPEWAKDIAAARQPGDAGLGDTVVHLIGDTRSENFKKWFQEKFGRSCGCTERQAWLNRLFPYANMQI